MQNDRSFICNGGRSTWRRRKIFNQYDTGKIIFPYLTLIVNLIGAVIIGIITGISEDRISKNGILFLKTGLCGGFTTFSTFSLETFTLLENGRIIIGGVYALASLILCVSGVFFGKILAQKLFLK